MTGAGKHRYLLLQLGRTVTSGISVGRHAVVLDEGGVRLRPFQQHIFLYLLQLFRYVFRREETPRLFENVSIICLAGPDEPAGAPDGLLQSIQFSPHTGAIVHVPPLGHQILIGAIRYTLNFYALLGVGAMGRGHTDGPPYGQIDKLSGHAA